uniref:AAA domain-containing protein n=1 Tax=Caenorhabditis tropicalis TaxID=1561998 RepID=A0A1I7TMF5_9PELO
MQAINLNIGGLLQNTGLLRTRNGVSRKPIDIEATAATLSRVYYSVWRQFGATSPEAISQMNTILKDSMLTRRVAKKSEISLNYDDAVVRIIPSTSSFYIQRRGFRTRKQTFGVGSAGKVQEEVKSPLTLFSELLTGKKTKNSEGGVEKWNQYEADLKKLPEGQQRTYTDGFVKGDRQLGSLFFSNPQEVNPEDVQVTFEDVRGMDEAKLEVEEIVDYLKDPEKYSRLGGRLPKGVLLVGPPGTGKTLLARAIAGEAQVPFFHTSGSEFDEVLVGQGARRVRDLFDKAKARAPCIIFIDEIDSVGSKRVSNSIHPYANQTINQLLSEMDGFTRNEGIIVIAATNRVEDLDKALLRPGRFDVRVTVPKPDLAGRVDIFNFYLSKIVHSGTIDPKVLAKGSTGFTGADIENMVNQAALKAATDNAVEVTMSYLDEARDRVLMGPARTGGRIPDEEANRNTAYHEAGHTLVSLYTKDATPLHKVTIIPRGQSLGHTAMLPEKDSYQLTKAQMLATLDVMMGGRVAEELIFGDDKVTTGAADDLSKATQLAVQMVKVFGMSDKKEHQLLAEALLEYETLSADEVKRVISGGKIKRPTPAAVKKSNETKRNQPSLVLHLFEEEGRGKQ